MMLNKSIVREYDIRGIYGKTLQVHDAVLVGWSLAQHLKSVRSTPKVVVCRDGRLSSPALVSELIKGLLEGGAEVTDIGVGPTPLLYFSNFIKDVDAGIMVTGSHNPAEYNGFKFIVNKQAFFGESLKGLQKISAGYKTGTKADSAPKEEDISAAYISKLLGTYKSDKKFKIAWDAGNGGAGEIIQKLCKTLPGEHILLNCEIDGNFPAHHPDPTVLENLEQLIDVVKSKKCDFGIAFDGDGDRIGVVDSTGRVIWGDQLLIILARDILSRNPGKTIIGDIKASQVFIDELKKYGGNPVLWKTGHSNIKKHMKDVGSPLAGEMSGHIFIADDYYGYDDAIYTAVRLLNIFANMNETLDEFIDALPKVFNTPELRIQCDDDKKFGVIDSVREYFKSNNMEFSDIDGVRYNFKGGWGLIRASNTQDVLVCRFEADTREKISREFSFMQEILAKFGVNVPNSTLSI